MNKPLVIAYKPFRAMNMKANTSKEKSFYTQGQRFAARILFILWLLASVNPESVLAIPKRQPATTSPGDPSLASTPPTPLPGGILQLPPDAPGSFWGDSVASSPSTDAALQRQRPSSLLPRTLDKLTSRVWGPRPQATPRTPAGPIAEGSEAASSSNQHPAVAPSDDIIISSPATPSTLKQLMSREDVPDNKTLVLALNAAPSQEQRQWLEKAVEWFDGRSIATLYPAAIRDYAALAHIQVTPANSELLKRYLHSLCNKVKEGPFGEELLIQALAYVLAHINKAIFVGDPHSLLTLGDNLLAKLNPSQREFKQADYPSARASLEALFQALFLAKEVAPGHLNVREGGLYQSFRNRLQEIINRAQYYPVIYQSRILMQTLRLLESSEPDLEGNLRRIAQGLLGVANLVAVGQGLATGELKPAELQEGIGLLQQAFEGQRIQPEAWYSELLSLEAAMVQCLQQQALASYPEPTELVQRAKDIPAQCRKRERLAALIGSDKINQYKQAFRFGIVMQLRTLSLAGPTPELRQGSIERLIALGQPSSWGPKTEVMAGLRESLALVASQSQSERASEATSARKALEGFTADASAAQWLAGEELPAKLQRLREQTTQRPPSDEEGLFVQVRQSPRPATPTLLPGASSISPEAWEAIHAQLVSYYSGSDFPYVPSLFDEQDSKHVQALECQLMLREKKLAKQETKEASGVREDQVASHHMRLEEVKTPIALQDLFKARSVRPDKPVQAVDRILLTGDPGTGKTTVSKKLAYLWSEKQWGQEFHTLYLLPVRNLQKDRYNEDNYRKLNTLATAIVNNCFIPPSNEDEYKRLRAIILRKS